MLLQTVLCISVQEALKSMVTPKEVDLDIEDLCSIISGAIDRALHTIVSEPNV